MAGSLAQSLIISMLSASLLKGGTAPPTFLPGQSGVVVSQLQADLNFLGMRTGKINGVWNTQSVKALDEAVTVLPLSSSQAVSTQVQTLVSQEKTVSVSGKNMMAHWLYQWKMIAVRHPSAAQLAQGVAHWAQAIGIANPGVTSAAFVLMAHLQTIRLAYLHHWMYKAEPHDTMQEMAFATGVPLRVIEKDNPAHGHILWVGQVVNWYPLPVQVHPILEMGAGSSGGVPASAPAKKKTESTPSTQKQSEGSSASQPILVGVYGGIDPLDALVVMTPTASEIKSLLAIQKKYRADRMDQIVVAVLGIWAQHHAALMRQAVQQGNEIAIAGYRTTAWNTLSAQQAAKSAILSQKALAPILAQTPVYVVTNASLPSNILQAIDQSGAYVISSNQTGVSMHAVLNDLLVHSRQVVVWQPPATSALPWSQLFSALNRRHFAFMTLAQIWANQTSSGA
ncbi:MAG: polysaccharide deacetylase family protein [Firmicutes bacterium]|nr:polysaccharide deacetylase family protein [Bacillota bacterium]